MCSFFSCIATFELSLDWASEARDVNLYPTSITYFNLLLMFWKCLLKAVCQKETRWQRSVFLDFRTNKKYCIYYNFGKDGFKIKNNRLKFGNRIRYFPWLYSWGRSLVATPSIAFKLSRTAALKNIEKMSLYGLFPGLDCEQVFVIF